MRVTTKMTVAITGGLLLVGWMASAQNLIVDGTVSVAGNQVLSSNTAADTYANIRVLRSASSLADGMYIGYGSTGGPVRFYAGGATNPYLGEIGSAGTFLMGGNVGVGTTAPAEKLDVSGAIRASGGIYSTTPGNYSQTSLLQWGLSSPGTMYLEPGAGSTLYLTDQWSHTGTLDVQFGKAVFETGDVGIGTTSPSYKLQVIGAGGFDTLESNSSGDPLEINYYSAAPTKICATSGCSVVSAYFAPTTGNVGIGTTSPIASFNVRGTAFAQEGSGTNPAGISMGLQGTWPRISLDTGAGAANVAGNQWNIDAANSYFRVFTAGSVKMYMQTNGAMWIAGALTQNSQRASKDNIRVLSDREALTLLSQLKSVKYEYKGDRGNEQVGFIADDTPELISGKGRKGIKVLDTVAVLTKVVQAQQEQVIAQRAELKAQRAEIEALKKRLGQP